MTWQLPEPAPPGSPDRAKDLGEETRAGSWRERPPPRPSPVPAVPHRVALGYGAQPTSLYAAVTWV